MKKIFTLAVSAMIALASAATTPTTIFSYVVTAEYSESVKGAEGQITDLAPYGFLQYGGSLTSSGKSDLLSKSSLVTNKNTGFCVSLKGDLKLQAGDIISFSAIAEGAEDLTGYVNICPIDKRTTEIQTKNEYTVTDEDNIHGLGTFYFFGTASSAVRIKSVSVVRTRPTTGIENVRGTSTSQTKVKKCVKDGRIVVMRDGVEYDTLGRRIN